MALKDELLSECLGQQNPDESAGEEQTAWRDKPLHGMYHRQIEEVAGKCRTDSTEALIMAAQEQAINTRAIEARVDQTQDADCA